MGVPPTGQTHSIPGITISRFSNGKAVEEWPQRDTLRLAQNLGLAPLLGAPPPRMDTREARPH